MTNMPHPDLLGWFAAHRVARLATVDANAAPTLVPVCFAMLDLDGELSVVIAIDEKPKSVAGRELRAGPRPMDLEERHVGDLHQGRPSPTAVRDAAALLKRVADERILYAASRNWR